MDMIRQILTLAWITYREALYGKLLWVCLAGMVALAGFADFFGEVVITGAVELQAGLVAWGLRWLGAIALILFCVNSVVREANDKITEMNLALPLRREVIYLGKLCGLLLLAFSFALMSALAESLFAPVGVSALWAGSLFLELTILCSFTLWMVTSTGAAVGSVLLALSFYVLSRAMQGIEAMAGGPFFHPDSAYDHFMAGAVKVLGWIMPPLYEYASADWLVNGVFNGDLFLQSASSAVYVVMLVAAAMIELYRKQF
jgi:ABC-type transport system involved in multi-copper enzyme maturation permease subunit